MLYVAMFDEVDEGTAIFKCLKEDNLPLNGDGELRFVGIEKDVKSDHYLWLTGQASKWLRNEGEYGMIQPKRQ